MTPSSDRQEEVDSWANFLHARWSRYAEEQSLSEKAQRKQLSAFMAGGRAVLDAVLKFETDHPRR